MSTLFSWWINFEDLKVDFVSSFEDILGGDDYDSLCTHIFHIWKVEIFTFQSQNNKNVQDEIYFRELLLSPSLNPTESPFLCFSADLSKITTITLTTRFTLLSEEKFSSRRRSRTNERPRYPNESRYSPKHKRKYHNLPRGLVLH